MTFRFRVLMLIENTTYPIDPRVRAEAETLTNNGYLVSVICPSFNGQSFNEKYNGVEIFRYPIPKTSSSKLGYMFEYVYSLFASFLMSLYICIRFGFDIIHIANPPDTMVFIAGFYKLFGKSYIFDHHDIAPELYKARFGDKGKITLYKIMVWLEKLSCKVADHIIVTNLSYKKNDIERAQVPENKITIVRNGPNRLEIDAEPYNEFKQRDRKILVYVGVIGVQDGVDYLIRVLQSIIYQLDRKDIFCIMVGDGDALPGVKKLADNLRVSEFIKYTGMVNRDDVARYLKTADICVAPEPSNSYNDFSTAIKIMEYMAFGNPIVAFDLPEHRFSAQGAAIYAHPNDELDFAEKITMLMDDPELRQKMGEIGKKRVETELAWSHQAKHLLAVYEKITAGIK